MSKRKLLVIVVALILSLTLTNSLVFAETEAENDDLAWRLQLIQASRDLMEEREKEADHYYRKNKLGVMFTNFGSENSVINAGLRMENVITIKERDPISILSEAIYLREEETLTGFVSLMLRLLRKGYIGGGLGVTEHADYQLFAGMNITPNTFVEGKWVVADGEFSTGNFYLATGLQFNF